MLLEAVPPAQDADPGTPFDHLKAAPWTSQQAPVDEEGPAFPRAVYFPHGPGPLVDASRPGSQVTVRVGRDVVETSRLRCSSGHLEEISKLDDFDAPLDTTQVEGAVVGLEGHVVGVLVEQLLDNVCRPPECADPVVAYELSEPIARFAAAFSEFRELPQLDAHVTLPPQGVVALDATGERCSDPLSGSGRM